MGKNSRAWQDVKTGCPQSKLAGWINKSSELCPGPSEQHFLHRYNGKLSRTMPNVSPGSSSVYTHARTHLHAHHILANMHTRMHAIHVDTSQKNEKKMRQLSEPHLGLFWHVKYNPPAHGNYKLQQGSPLLALSPWNNLRQTSPKCTVTQVKWEKKKAFCVCVL